MKKVQQNLLKTISFIVISFFFASALFLNDTNAQTKDHYKVLDIKNEINSGKDKEIKMLFEGERRKIVQLTLRNGRNLRWHSVPEPITIQCIAGEGDMLIKTENQTDTIKLLPDTFITLDPLVDHDIIGKPDVSILLIRFLTDEDNDE
ncbi:MULTISPECIES: hypothetical protein [unclassified Melioribacter]|uniref:hypothetical protein n=1 Tax=unclassified Melioribacter TaxID=2627329 RepID=UPI003BE58951